MTVIDDEVLKQLLSTVESIRENQLHLSAQVGLYMQYVYRVCAVLK